MNRTHITAPKPFTRHKCSECGEELRSYVNECENCTVRQNWKSWTAARIQGRRQKSNNVDRLIG